MQRISPEVVLHTERLVLEPLEERHASLLFHGLQDGRIYRYIPQDPPASPELLAQRYRRLQTRRSPDGSEAWLNWAVRLTSWPHYVGRVEATVSLDATASVAYEFFPEFWGQGFATEACRAVLHVLFANYGVVAISAEVDTRNSASIRLLKRLGFARTDWRQGADFFKGEVSDEYTYRLTAPEGSA